ncbi:MAG: TOBE domain-containing protein [Sulfurimonas sp.]|uniref:TOBE domain-containing protein n=1 Tax=Sulfurimonas sp. TaxID=2022749 RepID=UPI0025D2613F|nr:TOBE domain-containing protein [Sulfurimonas sp.]MCK9492178.1 TOBE domain-containing protein [Sulfurimonas sp.]
MKIDGRFWLSKDGESFLGSGRIQLLKIIEKTGSMNAAAKEMKMSYKAAWERVNSMNALADEPLITRTTGGRGGGGTTLTPYAHQLIQTYDRLRAVHAKFIDRFAEAGGDADRLESIINRTFLTTSARNQLPSKVKSITQDELSTNLDLSLLGDVSLISNITAKSAKDMALHEGSDTYAIIKSSDIEIVKTAPKAHKNLNIMQGIIDSIETSEHSLEITFKVNSSLSLIAAISRDTLDTSLEVGSKAYAIINTKNIIIGL